MSSSDVSARSAAETVAGEERPARAVGDAQQTPAPLHKSHRALPRPPFECVSLVLQGGGALGAFQAGVYQALVEADLQPDWVAGISVGAINAALIGFYENIPSRKEHWWTVPRFVSAADFRGLADVFRYFLDAEGFAAFSDFFLEGRKQMENEARAKWGKRGR